MARSSSLSDTLENILQQADGQAVSVRYISRLLADKGYAILFVILSFPVCFPITMPGICEPIGLVMMLLGIRYSLNKSVWWPEWVLAKEMPYDRLRGIVNKAKRILSSLQKVMYARLAFLVVPRIMQIVHGLLICVLSLLLALPLPIPLTNTFAAVPIFILGLAILENDGVAVLVAYVLALVCFIAFGLLFWFGEEGLHWLWLEI